LRRPVTTLSDLCAAHAPPQIEFLKVDVEGAETEVLRGADFVRFRPKVIVIEAYKPITMEPAYAEWEPVLAAHGYATAWDDELNRYYVADEAKALAANLAAGPAAYPGVPKVSGLKPAAEDASHPDHRLARLLAGADMAKLPLTRREEFLSLLTAGLDEISLAAPATGKSVAAVTERLFGVAAGGTLAGHGQTVRDVYANVIDSDRFRAACGRICASYAW
jgi:hypothetical protein